MIRDSKLREDAPQTSNEKNKSGKKRSVSIFKSLKNVTVCHDSKDLQLHGNQFILTEIVDHIIRTTPFFMSWARGGEETKVRIIYFALVASATALFWQCYSKCSSVFATTVYLKMDVFYVAEISPWFCV